ncbi:hypothetical protein CEXT_519861 [Caerostris extrusa]|uniref:Secreted protein n=1 Tax=Caerostris extrusa TaxID=172846 RepID=A0AAV4W1P9_CAEEX|nr:hypothetical protein CEXT_519861 [Caerostris extrusa]
MLAKISRLARLLCLLTLRWPKKTKDWLPQDALELLYVTAPQKTQNKHTVVSLPSCYSWVSCYSTVPVNLCARRIYFLSVIVQYISLGTPY